MSVDLSRVYDEFARGYDENRGLFDMSEVIDTLLTVTGREGKRVLDLGCGVGVPVDQTFIKLGWDVTGLDFSAEMLKLAEKYLPEMTRIKADMLEVEFTSEAFDVVTAIYSLFHLPSSGQSELFKRVYSWLDAGGVFYFTYATREYTGEAEFEGYKEFMGRELFYSHRRPEALFAELEETGFKLLRSDYRSIGGETFLWVCAGK